MPDNKPLTECSADELAAAEQVLAVLAAVSRLSNQDPGLAVARPIGAAVLARLIFGAAACAAWGHETRRRRARESVAIARLILVRDQAPAQICASTAGKFAGYWLESDPATLARYAATRRRHGLGALKAASQIKASLGPAGGQQALFPVAPVPSPASPHSQFRH